MAVQHADLFSLSSSTQRESQPNGNEAHDHGALYNALRRDIHSPVLQDLRSAVVKPMQSQRHQHEHDIDRSHMEPVLFEATEPTVPESQHFELATEQRQRKILPRTVDMDRQQRTAEEVVYLLNPESVSVDTNSKKRKRGSGSPRSQEASAALAHDLRFRNYGPRKKRKQDSENFEVESSTTELVAIEGAESYATAAVAAVAAASSTDGDDMPFFFNEYASSVGASDARAAGVYSAAALFRKPSINSKNNTRPPMSKLFTSLQLSPENFLRLQAAAKAYMLNPEFPERRKCVGSKGTDTDMTKLKMYNCVKGFLEEGPDGGHGAKFFGLNSDGREGLSWGWPANMNRIITLCTPLLRRMVTNERQRQYAKDARKTEIGQTASPGSRKGRGAGKATSINDGVCDGDANTTLTISHVDPSLGSDNDESGSCEPTTDDADKLKNCRDNGGEVESSKNVHPRIFTNPLQLHPPASDSPLRLHFCVVSNTLAPDLQTSQRRLIGIFDLPSNSCRTFTSLCKNIATTLTFSANLFTSDNANIGTSEQRSRGDQDADVQPNHGEQSEYQSSQHQRMVQKMQALTPSGLVPITDQRSWTLAKREVESTVWMEGLMKIVVEVDGGSEGHGSVAGTGPEEGTAVASAGAGAVDADAE